MSADVHGILNDLDKYAGWLSRDLGPARLREAVKRLATEFERGCDVRYAVDMLEREIVKMPSSHVGLLLQKAIRRFRLAAVERAIAA